MEVEQLIKQYGPKVSLIARRMIRNEDVAREAAQEVWCQVIASLESFRGGSSFSTWLYTVARRTIMHYARREQTYSSDQFDEHFSLPQIDYKGSEPEKLTWVKVKCDDCLTAFCHCLDNRARLIFVFHEITGLSFGEIGRIMEISEENARKIASRSKVKVQSFMERDCLLFSKSSNCRCRIKGPIKELNLHNEYKVLAQTADLADFYKHFEVGFPRVNFWESLLKK